MIRTKGAISRRKLMTGAAATAALTPFVPILESEAQVGRKQRFISFMGQSNGVIQDQWTPEGSPTDFEFKRILAPLEEWKQKMVVVAGTSFNRTGPGNKHMKGPAQMFCGSPLNEGKAGGNSNEGPSDWARSISVEQAFANTVEGQTPFKSVVMACETDNSVRGRIAYLGDNQPIVPELNPTRIFDQVFGSAVGAPEDLERVRAEKRSVLDVVQSQLTWMESKYSFRDKTKIEAHLESVRAVETRLSRAVPSCNSLDRPKSGGGLPEKIDAMQSMIAPMLACDLTRTISFMYVNSTSQVVHRWVDVSERHHTASHDDNGAHKEDLVRINAWYSGKFAEMLELLDAVDEGDGTLLDNTLILNGNEMGTGGSHSDKNIPVLLAGGVDRIQMGRYLQTKDQLNNRTLVGVLQALGLEIDTFGVSDTGSGPLPGLLTS